MIFKFSSMILFMEGKKKKKKKTVFKNRHVFSDDYCNGNHANAGASMWPSFILVGMSLSLENGDSIKVREQYTSAPSFHSRKASFQTHPFSYGEIEKYTPIIIII